MRSYIEIKNYFERKKQNLIDMEKVFRIFLHSAEYIKNEDSLSADFRTGQIIFFSAGNLALKALRQARDEQNLSVLAYALAGDISVARYTWLLKQLDAETFETYSTQPWSLVAIAATFGDNERLQLLLDGNHYKPTEEALIQGLFYATYHGHKEVFNFIFEKINVKRVERNDVALTMNSLDSLTDEGNTLFQVVVMGGNVAMFDYIAEGNPVDYDALISVLATHTVFLPEHKIMLDHLRPHTSKGNIHAWIAEATAAENNDFITQFSVELSNDVIVNNPVFHEELQFRNWLKAIEKNISDRLKAYVKRKSTKEDLVQLAEDDRVISYSPSQANKSTRKDRINAYEKVLNSFFEEYAQNLRKVYENIPKEKRSDTTLFSKQILLKRSELIDKIRCSIELKNSPGRENFIEQFKAQLLQALTAANNPTQEQSLTKELMTASDENESFDGVAKIGVSGEKAELTSDKMLESPQHVDHDKKRRFIEAYTRKFDQIYQIYACLSEGKLMRKPDELEKMATTAKEVAIGILPSVHISAASLGIPLPISLSIPTGAAVAAVIDLYLLLRANGEQRKAHFINKFFKSATVRERTDRMYDLAEFTENRFHYQIDVLDSADDHIPYFAEITVMRFFNYTLKNLRNTQAHGRSTASTVMNKFLSPFLYMPPESSIIKKSLEQIAIDAYIERPHWIYSEDDPEERELNLNTRCRVVYNGLEKFNLGKSKNEQFKLIDWTPKGIIEHTGIRLEDGRMFVASSQDSDNFGYINAMEEEVNARGDMKLVDKKDIRKHWFYEKGYNIPQAGQNAAAMLEQSSSKSPSWISRLGFSSSSSPSRQNEGKKLDSIAAKKF